MSDDRQAQVDLILAYKRCFAGADGRAVLGDLIRRFGYTRSSTLAPGQPDVTARNEGQRSVLVHVGTYIDVTPESLEVSREKLARCFRSGGSRRKAL